MKCSFENSSLSPSFDRIFMNQAILSLIMHASPHYGIVYYVHVTLVWGSNPIICNQCFLSIEMSGDPLYPQHSGFESKASSLCQSGVFSAIFWLMTGITVGGQDVNVLSVLKYKQIPSEGLVCWHLQFRDVIRCLEKHKRWWWIRLRRRLICIKRKWETSWSLEWRLIYNLWTLG